MVMVEVTVPPLAGETEDGEKLQVDPRGCPEQERFTEDVNPLRPPRVRVKEAGCPALMVNVEGEAAMLKSAVGG